MKGPVKLKNLAPGLWTMAFPLLMLGVDLQRNVTILRLSSGKLVIHSSAPFTANDISVIRKLGEPAWLADVLLRHDTFAREGQAAFPDALYLAPDGFQVEGASSVPLLPAPAEWGEEIEVIPVGGIPAYGEIVMFHRATRTLIVGDLLINFSGKQDLLSKVFLKIGAAKGKYDPGVTRPLMNAIEDAQALASSLRQILTWDFDRIIVGHGDPIRSGGKAKLRSAFSAVGIEGI
jgi:hypothetical protein